MTTNNRHTTGRQVTLSGEDAYGMPALIKKPDPGCAKPNDKKIESSMRQKDDGVSQSERVADASNSPHFNPIRMVDREK